MSGFRIYTVDTGNGSDVYHCDSYSYDTEGKKPDGSGVTIVRFIARNGRNAGKVHKMPLHRIDHIVDMTVEKVPA